MFRSPRNLKSLWLGFVCLPGRAADASRGKVQDFFAEGSVGLDVLLILLGKLQIHVYHYDVDEEGGKAFARQQKHHYAIEVAILCSVCKSVEYANEEPVEYEDEHIRSVGY